MGLVCTTFILLSISHFSYPLSLAAISFSRTLSIGICFIPKPFHLVLLLLHSMQYIYCAFMYILRVCELFCTKHKCIIIQNLNVGSHRMCACVREREGEGKQECLQHHKHHSNKRLLMHTLTGTHTHTHKHEYKNMPPIFVHLYALPPFHFALTHIRHQHHYHNHLPTTATTITRHRALTPSIRNIHPSLSLLFLLLYTLCTTTMFL